jgi:hypothetical protein
MGAVAFPLQIFSWWPFAVVRRRAAVAAVGWSGEGAEEVATHLELDRLCHAGGWRLTGALLTSRSGRPALSVRLM